MSLVCAREEQNGRTNRVSLVPFQHRCVPKAGLLCEGTLGMIACCSGDATKAGTVTEAKEGGRGVEIELR